MLNRKIPYVIAEVGSNHLGKKAIRTINLPCKKAGADCVKFQLFDENNLVNQSKSLQARKDKRLKYQHEIQK